MGLFNDLFGNDKKKSQEAFGLFSFLEDQNKENESGYTEEELESYGLEELEKEEYSNNVYLEDTILSVK